MSTSTSTRLKTTGLSVNVRVEGAGPPLLFLSGSNFDLSIKAPIFDSELPNYFTVAAFDPRGLGLSDSPPGDWNMKDYANDALLVLDALNWTEAHIVGESFGAMVALHLAILAPHRINKLALAAGSAGGAGGSSYPIETFLEIEDAHARAIAQLSILDSRFVELLQNDPDAAHTRIRARIASEAEFMAHSNNRTGYPRLLKARAQHNCWSGLAQIKTPTLIFTGRYDQQAPPARAQSMAKAMPNALLYTVDDSHSHCFTSTQPVATMIEQWITRFENRGSSGASM